MGNLDNNGHSVYLMYYHLILVVKYRRKVIDDAISNRGKEIFLYIADNYGITLEEWNHDLDHVHIMFRAQPKTELSKFINAYKSASSRLLKKNIPRSGRNCGKKHSGARASVFSQRGGLPSRQSDSISNRRGSRKYEKQRRKVAKCHRKIRNQRNDYQHKLSREIAERYDAVAVEDIDMKAMSRGLHFGKSVMDNGFGAFRDKLAYKLEMKGKRLIKVDRFYPSSKRCSSCGQVKKELGLGERIYTCSCGMRMDRDINAAINIREEGRRLLEA